MSKPALKTGTVSELLRVSVHEPAHLHSHSESRSALPFKHRTMGTSLHVAIWATECLVAHAAPVGCRVAHPPLVAGHTLQDNGFCNWICTPRQTHKSRSKELQVPASPVTPNWPKEGMHDVGSCGRIASRDKRPIPWYAGAVGCTM